MAFSYSDNNFTVIGNLCFVHIILDEYDTAISESSAFTSGVPDGANNWREAYDNLRKDYVKSFLGSNQPKTPPQEPNSTNMSVEEAAKAFVNQMYGRK